MTRDDELRLHAYLDGELGATESIEFERRLGEDGELRQGLAELRAIGERIRSQARYYDAPAHLRARILARTRDEQPHRRRRLVLWSSLATAAALTAVVAGFAPGWIRQTAGWQPRVDEVLDDHLRATLGSHWVDVASSDRHTVKPWLSARLGFSPAVPDLSEQGFELVGGRLDVLDAKPAATLVYRRRQHMISVFVWPGGASIAPEVSERRGYHMIRFAAAGFSYCIVSDLNEAELRDLARLLSAPS
ncbi:MAG TPA: anti-sigma factor [Burkholderiaceae bacterium]|jgi:anti-sigma factor RsiW|nr:anti-sigma factor [Burkholderiaceae bacterium]